MSYTTKINRLITTSKEVLRDCSLQNGAIVAANSTMPYYPPQAKNYFYVWPRDASFACIASDILGLDISERFFDWLTERAEGLWETGLLYEKYDPNGSKALDRFQPDQTGTVLFAIAHHFMNNSQGAKKYKGLVTCCADGICNAWKTDHFTVITNDLWEERLTFPDLKENFTYSIAACIKGLLSANEMFPEKRYVKTASEMRDTLYRHVEKKGHILRSFGRLNDARIDASALGVIWPFDVIKPKPENLLAENTLQLIEEKLVRVGGVYRYEHDEYCGWMYQTLDRRKGAGFWPLLNFWMSIVLNRMGRREDAIRYYDAAISSVDVYIPEQVFNNDIQVSVSPLSWSHSMFVLASRELGVFRL